MLGIVRLMRIVLALCLSPVTGTQFTMSSNEVDLTNPPQAIFWMNCTAASISDVNAMYVIKIVRESRISASWEAIATVSTAGPLLTSNLPSYWTSAQVSGSTYAGPDPPITNSYINFGVNASSFKCDDARTYRCEIQYLSSDTLDSETVGLNSSLTITAQPYTPEMEASHGNTNEVFFNVGSSSDNPADMSTGELLEISCTADIGSDSSRTIQWRKSSEVGFGELIHYNGYVDEGTAAPIAGSGCRYTRTSTMRYNTSVVDANRDSTNNLRFLCIVNGAPTDRNRTFYVRVVGVPTSDDDSGDLSSPVNTVVGASVGTVFAIVIIVIVIIFVVRRLQIRNNTNNGRKESVTLEHSQRLPTLATHNVNPVNPVKLMSLSERNEGTQYEELHIYVDVSDNYSSICQERGQNDNSTGVYINTTVTQ